MKFLLLTVLSLPFMACSEPTGYEVTDKIFVKDFEERMQLTQLYYTSPWTCNVGCGLYTCQKWRTIEFEEYSAKAEELGLGKRLRANNQDISNLLASIKDNKLLFQQNYQPKELSEIFIPEVKALSCEIYLSDNEQENIDYYEREFSQVFDEQEKWLKQTSALYNKIKGRTH